MFLNIHVLHEFYVNINNIPGSIAWTSDVLKMNSSVCPFMKANKISQSKIHVITVQGYSQIYKFGPQKCRIKLIIKPLSKNDWSKSKLGIKCQNQWLLCQNDDLRVYSSNCRLLAWNPTIQQLAGRNSNFDKSRLGYDVTFYLSRKVVRKMFHNVFCDVLSSEQQNCWKQWS